MVNVSLDITPYITATLNVQIAVIEKHTTGNVGNNGETSFEHVMMKMLPDASGTNVDFVTETSSHIFESFDMSSTNVEEMDDLAIVVFVQDADTKEILQAGFVRNENLGVDDSNLSTISIYPNPSNGELNITTDTNLQVIIYDLLGKEVYSSEVNNSETLDISNLNNGVYMVKLSNGNSSTTKKLIVSK
jgi:hypothetical protein